MAIRASIGGIAVALPSRVVDNEKILENVDKEYADHLLRRIGVRRRRVANYSETALDLAERACLSLFAAHPTLPNRLDSIVFCTQTPDYILPPNSCVLHGRLGLPSAVAAFDVPHACSAFIYALKIAGALISAREAEEVLIVNSDTYSKLIDPFDRSVSLLFGDAAAATWVTRGTGSSGIRAIACGTQGKLYDRFWVELGGARDRCLADTSAHVGRSSVTASLTTPGIRMNGKDMLGFVLNNVPDNVNSALAQAHLSVDDVDFFVFHQASGIILDMLSDRLGIDAERVPRELSDVGNTVSASIPIVLNGLKESGRLSDGDVVVLSGFGAGLSWGTAVLVW